MHNIDRTNLESNYGEYSGEYTGEYGGTEFGYEAGEQESETYGEYTQEGTFSEADEMELAAELLSVSNEAELDQFLGKLFKKAGAFIKGPVGQKLLGGLKSIAKKALPTLGGAFGNLIAPGIGGAIGSNLASQAGSMFGLELEGLSYEDQEFEVAKQIVRLGGAAASNAAQAASSTTCRGSQSRTDCSGPTVCAGPSSKRRRSIPGNTGKTRVPMQAQQRRSLDSSWKSHRHPSGLNHEYPCHIICACVGQGCARAESP